MGNAAAHVPRCALAPPLRCCQRVGSSPARICGELARWQRPGNYWFATEYFCDEHRAPTDTEIAGERIFRRVRVTCDVLFAAVDVNAPIAQTEALARLEQAVQAAGGVLDVERVISNVVKWEPQPGQGRASGGRGGPW